MNSRPLCNQRALSRSSGNDFNLGIADWTGSGDSYSPLANNNHSQYDTQECMLSQKNTSQLKIQGNFVFGKSLQRQICDNTKKIEDNLAQINENHMKLMDSWWSSSKSGRALMQTLTCCLNEKDSGVSFLFPGSSSEDTGISRNFSRKTPPQNHYKSYQSSRKTTFQPISSSSRCYDDANDTCYPLDLTRKADFVEPFSVTDFDELALRCGASGSMRKSGSSGEEILPINCWTKLVRSLPMPTGGLKKKRAKKPKDMPRRPLSAYNIFFKDQRSKLIAEKGLDHDRCDDATLKMNTQDSPQSKIGFERLAQIIGRRWKEISDEEREMYTARAAEEMARYRREMELYKKNKSGDSADIPVSAENMSQMM